VHDAGVALHADLADCGPITSTTDPAVFAVVRARGNARLTRNDVCHSISLRAGDRFDAARIASDIHTLWDTRAFDDVVVERKDSGSGGVLTFVVRERPLLGRVVIDGATAIAANALRSMIRLHDGEPLDVADVEAARDAIRAAYLESGYRSAKVDFRLDPASPMTTVVSFRVDEGPLAVVRTFAFTGMSLTTDKELREQIDTRKGTVNVPGSIYGQNAAERTVLLVQAHLYDRGLLQSRVDAPGAVAVAGRKIADRRDRGARGAGVPDWQDHLRRRSGGRSGDLPAAARAEDRRRVQPVGLPECVRPHPGDARQARQAAEGHLAGDRPRSGKEDGGPEDRSGRRHQLTPR
jgi:hypothetical protein